MGRRGTEKRPVGLTNKFVAKLTGEEMWWDDDPKATGFGVRSYRGGGKSFFVDYRLNGRQRRYTIGPFPHWSAEAAREQAKKLRKEIDQDVDSAGDKRARRTAPTVQDLIDRYAEDHLPKKTLVGPRLNDEKKMLAEVGDKLGRHTKVADVHGGTSPICTAGSPTPAGQCAPTEYSRSVRRCSHWRLCRRPARRCLGATRPKVIHARAFKRTTRRRRNGSSLNPS